MADNKSTYFVIGRTQPTEHCTDFNPGELQLGDGWILDVYYDLICIWSADVTRPFEEEKRGIEDKVRLITDLFIFRARRLIRYELQSWVEARHIQSRANMIGGYVAGDLPTAPNRKSRASASWRRAAQKATGFSHNPQVRLAVRDYIAALRDPGDDAFLFAYRAIENSCRAVSGATGDLSASDWEAMHRLLGTSQAYILPLTNASKDIRHGHASGSAVKRARANREELLDKARHVLELATRKKVPGFF